MRGSLTLHPDSKAATGQKPITVDQSDLHRIPPQNLEAEQSMLGAMMLSRTAAEKAIGIVQPEDCYREAHRVLFQTITTMIQRDCPVDLTTLVEQLRTDGALEVTGGLPYLVSLLHLVPTAANVEYYSRIVRKKAILRGLITAAAEISHSAYEARDTEVSEVVDKAEQLLLSIGTRAQGTGHSATLGEVAHEWFTQLDEMARAGTNMTGLATGYEGIDILTGGFQRQDLILLAARPSQGKTALAVGMARHMAEHQPQPVVLFSLEMPPKSLVQRMICSELKMNSSLLRTPGALGEPQWTAIADAIDRIHQIPLYLETLGSPTVLQLRSAARKIRQRHKAIAAIFVDYVQLMTGSQSKNDGRNREIGSITQSLKDLARELDCPVVALSQLSRAVEGRSSGEPLLSDLRDSGELEQHADVVMLIKPWQTDQGSVQEEAPAVDATKPRVVTVKFAKHRNGPTGNVDLLFIPGYAQFRDLDVTHQEPAL